jgi:hypothetical protein
MTAERSPGSNPGLAKKWPIPEDESAFFLACRAFRVWGWFPGVHSRPTPD